MVVSNDMLVPVSPSWVKKNRNHQSLCAAGYAAVGFHIVRIPNVQSLYDNLSKYEDVLPLLIIALNAVGYGLKSFSSNAAQARADARVASGSGTPRASWVVLPLLSLASSSHSPSRAISVMAAETSSSRRGHVGFGVV